MVASPCDSLSDVASVPPQQVFAAKEAQLKELQAALAAERAGRAADAEGVAWLQSKVDALTQENYEVSRLPGQHVWGCGVRLQQDHKHGTKQPLRGFMVCCDVWMSPHHVLTS